MIADVRTTAAAKITAKFPQCEVRELGKKVPYSPPSDGCPAPAANGKPIGCLTLRRGTQLMGLVGGCPPPAVVLWLRQAQVSIGWAVWPNEVKKKERQGCDR